MRAPALHPDSEAEYVADCVVFQPQIRKINIPDAGYLIERDSKVTVTNQNTSRQQLTDKILSLNNYHD